MILRLTKPSYKMSQFTKDFILKTINFARQTDIDRAAVRPASFSWFIAALASGLVIPAVSLASEIDEVEHFSIMISAESDIYPTRSYEGVLSVSSGGATRCSFYWGEPFGSFFDQTDHLRNLDILFDETLVHWRPGLLSLRPETLSMDLGLVTRFPSPEACHREFLGEVIASVFSGTGTRSVRDVLQYRLLEEGEESREIGLSDRSSALDIRTIPRIRHSSSPPSSNWTDVNPFESVPFGRTARFDRTEDGGLTLSVSTSGGTTSILRLSIRKTNLLIEEPEELFDPDNLGRSEAIPLAYHRYWKLRRMLYYFEDIVESRRAEESLSLYLGAKDLVKTGVPDRLLSPAIDLLARSAAVAGDLDGLRNAMKLLHPAGNPLMPIGQQLELVADVYSTLQGASAEGTVFDEEDVRKMVEHSFEGRSLQDNQATLPDAIQGMISMRHFGVASQSLDFLASEKMLEESIIVDLRRQIQSLKIEGPKIASADVLSLKNSMQHPPESVPLTSAQFVDIVSRKLVEFGWKFEDAAPYAARVAMYVSSLTGADGCGVSEVDLNFSLARAATYRIPFDDASTEKWLAIMLAIAPYSAASEEQAQELLDQIDSLVQSAIGHVWNHVETNDQYAELMTLPEIQAEARKSLSLIIGHVGDPLWPMFKYPLSVNEIERVEARMKTIAFQEIDNLARYAGTTGDPEALRVFLASRFKWLSRSVGARILSVRTPPIAGLGQEMRTRLPLKVSCRLTLPTEPSPQGFELKYKLGHYFVGHLWD